VALPDRSNAIVLAAVVVAGIAIGFAGSTFAYRYGILRVPGEKLVDRMNRELRLDPSQREQIAELMEDARAEMSDMRRKLQRQHRSVMIATYLKVRAILNPDQQKKFDDEFIPPKFRNEAWQTQQEHAAPSIESPPSPSPSP
jgi:Spy/CpxP family protein refolding chaperone